MDDMSMRYAHCEGHTDVCYDDSGRYLISCGTDGDIRVYEGFEDDDPKTHHMGDIVNAIAFKDKKLYLSTDANAVVTYTFPDISCDGALQQFVVSVYHIACSENGRYIAAGGGEFIAKVYDTVEKTFTTYKGHEAPILSLAIDPLGTYLASSSCDGTVKVWRLTDSVCLQTWKLFKKSNDMCNSSTLCRLQFQPNSGKVLAVPVEKELKFYERDSWDCLFSLTDDSVTETLSLCCFSSCGSYIAAGATDGLLAVWDFSTKKFLSKKSHSKRIKVCSMAWNPSSKKELAFCDVEGQLGLFTDIDGSPIKKERKTSYVPLPDLDSDDDFGLDDDDDDLLKTASVEMNHIRKDDHDDEDNENAFDLGAIKAEYEPKIFGEETKAEIDETSSVKNVPTEPQIKVIEAPSTPLQTSFQPSSTPINLDQRFMVWNSIGIVRCYNTEEETSIDVEFHDASVYHPINLNNNRGFTMAALSSEALLLASPKEGDTPSHLECLHIGTWDSNKEWSIDMLEGEEIEAIALGAGWVAAAMDTCLIRIFTISGVQCEVFCCPGPVVCLATADNQLAVAYHRGAGLPGEQNLGLLLVKVNFKSSCVCREYSFPLSSKAYLAWLGFTDEGQLCSVDTSGIVRMLNVTSGSKWIPIVNTKSHSKGKSDNYFVVGLSEIHQEIRCIPCKGARYPPLLPRPTVTVLPFNLPFCEMTSDKGRLEEEQSRSAILHSRIRSLLDNDFDLDSELTRVERKWTDVLLKMFALATRADREYRALDISELMPSHRIVEGAIKYATQKHHMALADRLGEVVHKKIMEEAAASTAAAKDDDFEGMQDIPSNYKIPTSTTDDSPEEKLQPKPLSLSRYNRYSKELENRQEPEMLDDEPTSFQQQDASLSLLPKSSPLVNPFRVQAKVKEVSNGNDKLSNGRIDDILDESTRRLSSKGTANTSTGGKKTSRQAKLFPQKEKPKDHKSDQPALAPKKFGFALFLEENKEKIQLENPELEDAEIAKLATKLFKELPSEEKEKYKAKPKVGRPKKDEDSAKSNKRKHDSEEKAIKDAVVVESKKSKTTKAETKLSSGTQNKLAMFAFTKNSEN